MSFEFTEYKANLEGLLGDGDIEYQHVRADEILCEIAFSDSLTKEERGYLIEIYRQVTKWYA